MKYLFLAAVVLAPALALAFWAIEGRGNFSGRPWDRGCPHPPAFIKTRAAARDLGFGWQFCPAARKNCHAPIERQPSVIAKPDSHHGFTFQGKPVQPAIVKFFACWLADSPNQGPRIASVNLAACVASNWYPGPAKPGYKGSFFYSFGKNNQEYFGYQYLGVTSTHTYVLETFDNEGGSGVFETIFLMRFGTMAYYLERSNSNGLRKPQEVPTLKCIGQIDMGDRDTGCLTLRGNRLTLGKSQYRHHPETFLIP